MEIKNIKAHLVNYILQIAMLHDSSQSKSFITNHEALRCHWEKRKIVQHKNTKHSLVIDNLECRFKKITS